MYKVLTILFFFLSCVSEVTSNDENFFQIDNVTVELDRLSNQLYLQAEINHWNGPESLQFVKADLSILQDDIYESLGTFTLHDDGQAGDIIPGNGIYTLLMEANQLDFPIIESKITSVNISDSYQVSVSDNDSLNVDIIVRGKSLKVVFTAESIDGEDVNYTEYKNLSNSYVEIQTNTDGMYKDLYPNNDQICEREWGLTNLGYLYYFNIFNYNQLSSSNNFIYSTKIPFRPIDECGGTGEVLFKINIHDLDISNCISTTTENCLENLTYSDEKTLIIYGCGDGYCTSVGCGNELCETDISCSVDCR